MFLSSASRVNREIRFDYTWLLARFVQQNVNVRAENLTAALKTFHAPLNPMNSPLGPGISLSSDSLATLTGKPWNSRPPSYIATSCKIRKFSDDGKFDKNLIKPFAGFFTETKRRLFCYSLVEVRVIDCGAWIVHFWLSLK